MRLTQTTSNNFTLTPSEQLFAFKIYVCECGLIENVANIWSNQENTIYTNSIFDQVAGREFSVPVITGPVPFYNRKENKERSQLSTFTITNFADIFVEVIAAGHDNTMCAPDSRSCSPDSRRRRL